MLLMVHMNLDPGNASTHLALSYTMFALRVSVTSVTGWLQNVSEKISYDKVCGLINKIMLLVF